MSCVGTMIGLPVRGERMLFVDIMSARASTCASTDERHVDAIWSPSKSALYAAQTSGMELDGLALDQRRLEGLDAEAMERGRAVQEARGARDDLVRGCPHTSGRSFSTIFLALLMVVTYPRSRACCR
jgi:hypothetical protein